MSARPNTDPLAAFHPAVRAWFCGAFTTPTRAQTLGWPPIARGESTLILAPTGSGKTLAAFLWCVNRLICPPSATRGCRVLYISPLKALAVDVERNLREPLAGIAQAAEARGWACTTPSVAVRTGDTSAADRARFRRRPADILITTPESLYLLLTSAARETLVSVDTIIIDEIHALVPTKRGAHLALSLERLSARCRVPPQRIGLSATQRPLDEVARFLGGALPSRRRARVGYRPVTIVDAGRRKPLKLAIEVPLDAMVRPGGASLRPPPTNGSAPVGGDDRSVWTAIHPRLLDLVRGHRSTLIFVNSRRLAERMAGAINDLAGETIARSHHGSLSRAQRLDVETSLKAGTLRALVATSSLELGIDMGAIDLVVQIEAPPSVGSGLQRIGRSGHRVGDVSEGLIFPKFRGDLLACAATTRAMRDGAVEATRYPRNPLDVLAQHIVAMAAMDPWGVEALFDTIRRAAPFAELSRGAFEGVLDMLSGRYPSDAFAGLRPRITWDRVAGRVSTRQGARHVAIANGGTIPDRGLYGVFLVGADPRVARVGELDEEMVFESRVGETFVLGASTWRIEDITHDRVLVSAAPGEPGKMPFWKGDRGGRPLELGLAIGHLTHDLLRLSPAVALERLTRDHDLDRRAAEHLMQYLRDQLGATRAVPDALTIVVERVRDELGDWRLCVLSPRGGRIHAPWAMAAAGKIRAATGADVDTLWSDEGFVVRYPDVDVPPDPGLLLPDPDEALSLVMQQLGGTALFAGKFRENAARSLLLPRRRPGMRAPLWQQRKRSADLLAVAAGYGSFPIVLETYRECLRDFFDMPALVATLADVRSRKIRVVTVDSEKPSPFAASLLFGYVANFLYDGDAPLAERRAQALAVDQSQLRELLGDAEFRELLDLESMEALEQQTQRVDPRYRVKHADGVHDLLLAVGDLTADQVRERTTTAEVAATLGDLVHAGRVVVVPIAGESRYIAVEDAARYRDALDVPLPLGLPASLLEPAADAFEQLACRYARTHAPFPAAALAARFGVDVAAAEASLARLTREGRLVEGEFRPAGTHREWTDPGVLGQLRQRSLARLRREVEPVDHAALGRFVIAWHGILAPRRGLDALLDVVEQLQGALLPASILETEMLPARLAAYDPADLDALMAAGELTWVGVEPLGEHDGRVALYLTEEAPTLLGPAPPHDPPAPGSREAAILECLGRRGATFFADLHEAVGGGYPGQTIDALWSLAWRGVVTNDTFQAMRGFTRRVSRHRREKRATVANRFRPRRLTPPATEGRWSLVARPASDPPQAGTTRGGRARRPPPHDQAAGRALACTQQLLARHGVLTREAISNEAAAPASAVYAVLKALEERGRVRRGYFVSGLGATQFALPGALDLLRSLRDSPDAPEIVLMAATDPANPYGAALKWPRMNLAAGRGPTRTVGAIVILVDGSLAAYLARGEHQLLAFLPDEEPRRSIVGRTVGRALIERAREGGEAPRGMLIEEIDGAPAPTHPLAPLLAEAGFVVGAMGLQATFRRA